ncbi:MULTISPECIES: hypothetical protein [unclassified Leptotrichia]|uniref:hypothetical protein n=1 Tax=unclassified Leptotrichia TaxID=2633022 RepID=UPI0003AE557C|nr:MULTISPECIES: hypothetical protein [unclassified Leptotrichia]ERL03770.1 hypothetical protein HMPREF9108_02255 [Leptotrichia sp. oral taxon 225 str. F0581]WLD73298.1 hypothetical protein QU666_06575 [Leptotrichia sp. HMT-225]
MANKNKKGYKYIWAVPLNMQFELENSVSAYIEVNADFLNNEIVKKKVVKVNPYVRFNKIFTSFVNYYDNFFEFENKLEKDTKIKNLTMENTPKKESKINSFRGRDSIVEEKKGNISVLKKFKKNIENNAINYLQELDFVSGTTVIDVICEKISEDIKKGILGISLKKYFLLLNSEEQQYIALLIYNEKINNVNCMKNFRLGIKYFFIDSLIYRQRSEKNKIIIYINKPKNRSNIAKVKTLELLFLELGMELKVFWENHFGVVNVDETAKIDEIAVF